MSIALLLIFLLLSALGVPLAVALGLASVAVLVAFTSTPIDLLAQSMFSAAAFVIEHPDQKTTLKQSTSQAWKDRFAHTSRSERQSRR